MSEIIHISSMPTTTAHTQQGSELADRMKGLPLELQRMVVNCLESTESIALFLDEGNDDYFRRIGWQTTKAWLNTHQDIDDTTIEGYNYIFDCVPSEYLTEFFEQSPQPILSITSIYNHSDSAYKLLSTIFQAEDTKGRKWADLGSINVPVGIFSCCSFLPVPQDILPLFRGKSLHILDLTESNIPMLGLRARNSKELSDFAECSLQINMSASANSLGRMACLAESIPQVTLTLQPEEEFLHQSMEDMAETLSKAVELRLDTTCSGSKELRGTVIFQLQSGNFTTGLDLGDLEDLETRMMRLAEQKVMALRLYKPASKTEVLSKTKVTFDTASHVIS